MSPFQTFLFSLGISNAFLATHDYPFWWLNLLAMIMAVVLFYLNTYERD